MKRSTLVLLCFLCAAAGAPALTGCLRTGYAETSATKFGLMDTLVTVRIYSESRTEGETALNEVLGVIESLEKELSRHVNGSPAAEVNAKAGLEPVKVTDSLLTVARLSLEMGELTQGAFDITVSPLLDLWGFTDNEQIIPREMEIEALLPLVDYRQLQLEEAAKTLYLPQKGMAIDLGGVAKGYIIDKATEVLEKAGIKKAFINGGGDIRVLDTRTDGKPWRIGIRHPRSTEADAVIAVIALTDEAVVTSGDYQRFFMSEGKRYHHILDPLTGYPAANGVISVSVIAETTAAADMLATSIMVLGLDEGLPLIESLPGVDAVIITSDMEIHVTSGIKDRVELVS